LAFAEEIRPAHSCLVPERREELTTEGGLDVAGQEQRIRDAVRYQLLPEAGLEPVAQLQPGLFQGSELLSMADADWSAPGALAAA
ncbi:pyridoxine 5'-phosphate synthase, partial [Pseudomonas aeruginosa]|uniref:pyridoxine 5'-phosphate synthase n=1 Tax=Pseudomonas aeruginosa TaxID=287 RepID=UPI001D0B6C70